MRVLKLEPGTVLIVLVAWDQLEDREIKISIAVIMPHMTTNWQHLPGCLAPVAAIVHVCFNSDSVLSACDIMDISADRSRRAAWTMYMCEFHDHSIQQSSLE